MWDQIIAGIAKSGAEGTAKQSRKCSDGVKRVAEYAVPPAGSITDPANWVRAAAAGTVDLTESVETDEKDYKAERSFTDVKDEHAIAVAAALSYPDQPELMAAAMAEAIREKAEKAARAAETLKALAEKAKAGKSK